MFWISRILCGKLLSILSRGAFHFFFKDAAKIAGTAESAIYADIVDAVFGIDQCGGSLCDAVVGKILHRCLVYDLMKTPETFTLAYIGGGRNIIYCNVVSVVFMDIRKHGPYPILFK